MKQVIAIIASAFAVSAFAAEPVKAPATPAPAVASAPAPAASAPAVKKEHNKAAVKPVKSAEAKPTAQTETPKK